MSRSLQLLLILCVTYVAASLISNITSLKIVVIIGFSVDAGTLIYPFTFTLRDLIHKQSNISIARLIIWTTAVLNILMALIFQITALLPPDLAVGPQTEFNKVLSPVWRIVFASIISATVAELIDGEIYQIWYKRFKLSLQWGRVLTSNLISIPVDSIMFCFIAFYGNIPLLVIWKMVLTNVLIKLLLTAISIPWIYLVKESDANKRVIGLS